MVFIKNCLFSNSMPRTEERISKSRRAFNAVTAIGIRKRGVSMAACSILYWSIIVPIVTYGCETWVLSSNEISELRKFQRYVGRRCQCFPKRSPNFGAYTSLGWMSLDRVVQVKKLMFLRTILVMEDDDICKRILVTRARVFADNIEAARLNINCSPIFDILSVSIQVGLYDTCMRMINTGCYYSKEEWKKTVWEKVWLREEEDCCIMYKQPHQNYLLFNVIEKPYYIIWWILADSLPERLRMCEIMMALVCDASLLKSTDYRLKKKTFSERICTRCDYGTLETINLVVMQCPYHAEERQRIHDEIAKLNSESSEQVINDSQNYFYTVMGKQPVGLPFHEMVDIWLITGQCVSIMYKRTLIGRSR